MFTHLKCQNASLLVVDDDIVMQSIMKQTLSQQGYQIYTAENCASALAQSFQQNFDLVLLDVHLPDGSGLELAKRLSATPILFITQHDEHTAVENAIKGELSNDCIVGYLAKPLDFTSIEPTIRISVAIGLALKERNKLHKQTAHFIEQEKRALARELHDELGQTLVGVKWDTLAIKSSLKQQTEHDEAVQRCDTILEHISHLQGRINRIIENLHPEVLDTRGLIAAISALVDTWDRRITDCEFTLICDSTEVIDSLGLDYSSIVYRVVQEALTNAAAHAKASAVRIKLTLDGQSPKQLIGTIQDNGCGFTTVDIRTGRHGIQGMRERVLSLGGKFSIDSTPGEGTQIEFSIPLDMEQTPTPKELLMNLNDLHKC